MRALSFLSMESLNFEKGQVSHCFVGFSVGRESDTPLLVLLFHVQSVLS